VTFGGPAGATTSAFVPPGEPGPSTPLFLVPALGLDGRSFAPLAPLAKHRRVLFWSPPNELPRSPGLGALAASTIEHADRAGMPRRFVLGGSSLGAMIALAAALDAPERIAGLVLTGGTARWRDVGAPMRLARLLHPFIPRRAYHRAMPYILAPGNASSDPLLASLHAQMRRRTKPYADAVIAACSGAGGFDLSGRLGEIRVPTLVVHSRGDRIAPFRGVGAFSAIRGVRVVPFDGESHLPYLSEPERFVPILAEFLAGVDAGERR
jgi:pimeloyl-[acyl-carrier protein] methyl ester esterase